MVVFDELGMRTGWLNLIKHENWKQTASMTLSKGNKIC